MQELTFPGFDRIRIINLTYRADRRAQMNAELRRVGLGDDPRVAFFPAIRPSEAGPFTSIGAHGVFASHLSILEEAAAADESVLILEDDCDFTEMAAAFRTHVPWEIFYGGYEPSDPSNLASSDIIGAHMMGFSRSAAKKVSRYLRHLRYEGIHPPIDGAYVWFRRANPEIATLFAVPPLAHQRPSRTDIAILSFYDRWPGFRESVSLARRLKRLLIRKFQAAGSTPKRRHITST